MKAIRIEQEARRLGLKSRLAALQPERPNVLVSYGEGPETFAIIAHMDTVGEGNPEWWSSPPFAAEITGGTLIGRGGPISSVRFSPDADPTAREPAPWA